MKKLLLSLLSLVAVTFASSAETVTYDFVNQTYGLTRESGSSTNYLPNGQVVENAPAIIVLNNLAEEGTTNWRLWKDGLRATKAVQGEMSISVASSVITALEVKIANNATKISVNGSEAQAVAKGGTMTWDGNSETVTLLFTQSATTAVASIAITYEAVGSGVKQPAGLFYDKSSVEVNANELDKFVAPVLNNPNNLDLTFTSSDENVAEVDADGAVTLTGDEGEAVITAEFAGDDTYRAGKASYTIVVKNVPVNESTEANPYTVAKALELAASLDASTGIEGAYIKGYIVAITEVSTSFGNATYTIADAANATEGLTVFRGYYLNGDKFTAADQIKVGAEVVVFGKLINYQGKTPELAQGNKIISYNYEGDVTPVELEKVNSINATFALEAGTKFIVNYPLTVAFVHGANILLCDEAGDFIQIYLKDNGLAVGDRLPREWEATYGVRYGVPQLTPVNGLPEVSDNVAFTPAVVAAADVTPAIVNHVVTVKSVVFAEATPPTAANFTGTVGDVTLNFRNNYSVASVDAGTYNVTFWVNLYNGEPSLYVISYEKASTSGIDDIAADSADAVFYNLQGVKVANPENGLYIRVAGGQVSKVLVK